MAAPIKARIGSMRDIVTVEAAARTPDAFGDTAGPGTTWTAVAEDIPAEVVPVSGGEARPAKAPVALTTYRVRVRWTAAIAAVATTALRVTWEGKALNATGAVDVEGRRRFLEMTCLEGKGR